MKEIKFIWVCRNIHFDKIYRVELTDTMLINRSFPSWIITPNCEIIAKLLPIGRRDNNGVEIYQGDILCTISEDEKLPFYEEVKWDDELLTWVLDNAGTVSLLVDIFDPSCKIAGNIWENLELLA